MNTSPVHLVWANKPDCNLAVAEFWIGEEEWFILFWDDREGRLKIEILGSIRDSSRYLLDFAATEQLVERAKRDLLAMASTVRQ